MRGQLSSRPKRSLGQNFLTDPNTARKIVDSLGIQHDDVVLEIGPGRGALTGFLLGSDASRVIAVEKDRDLAPALPLQFPGLCVVNADAMDFSWERLGRLKAQGRGVRVVGNLPYNVASPILWELAWRCPGMDRAVFMVQLEVADRIVALPRTKAYGALSAWLQSFVEVKKLFKVGPSVFLPRPKVDSAVVAFTPKPPEDRAQDPLKLSRLLKMLFTMRRKQLKRILGERLTLRCDAYLQGNGLDCLCRPEELSPRQLSEMSELLF